MLTKVVRNNLGGILPSVEVGAAAAADLRVVFDASGDRGFLCDGSENKSQSLRSVLLVIVGELWKNFG